MMRQVTPSPPPHTHLLFSFIVSCSQALIYPSLNPLTDRSYHLPHHPEAADQIDGLNSFFECSVIELVGQQHFAGWGNVLQATVCALNQ